MMSAHGSAATVATAAGVPARVAQVTNPGLGAPARAVKVPFPNKSRAVPIESENDLSHITTRRPSRNPLPHGVSKTVLDSLTQPEEEVINDIRGFCAPRSHVETQLRKFVEGFLEYQRSCGYSSSHRERSNKLLTQELSSKGYQVALRHHSSQNNSTGISPSPNVRDTYIVFSGVPGHAKEEYIIELDFRDRFNIANPTAFYNTCLAAVPEVWVGPLEQLLPLVELLCSEMGMAFEECNLDMPPWRSHSKVVSRWLSSQVQSFSVDSVHTMAQSPSGTPPEDFEGSRGSSSGLSGHSPDNTGLTLKPLSLSQRTCSLSFDKIDLIPPSPVKNASTLKKATSLLAINILTTSPPASPTRLRQSTFCGPP